MKGSLMPLILFPLVSFTQDQYSTLDLKAGKFKEDSSYISITISKQEKSFSCPGL